MKKFYQWVLEIKTINKVISIIPENQKKVYNFAKKVGFIDEGVNRHSYKRDGNIYDQWYLGITRNEIEDYLK